jgi:hypothetical protein
MKPWLTTLLVFAASVVHAETYEALVERAFDSLETEIREHWAFTRTETSAKGVYVATHDPRREPAWELLTIDGREPTGDEREEFLSERSRESREDGDDDDEDETRSMVSPGSIELIEETDERWLFNFSPRADSEDERKFMQAVEGRLEIAKDGHYLRKIHLRNLETIKPGKGVKLNVFDTRFEFAPGPDGSAVLPALVRAKVQGRAMLVVGIDEEQTVEFSDYRRVLD